MSTTGQSGLESIGRGNFWQWEKVLSLKTQLLPSLYYVLPCVPLAEKEFDRIFDTLLPFIKRLHGLSSSFPSDLVHLPEKHGGLGIPGLYVKGISSRIKLLTSSFQQDNPLGKSIQILIEMYQLESGLSSSILKLKNAGARRYMTETWVSHLLGDIHGLGFYF